MERNLQDEIRILHDEVKKRLGSMLEGRTLSKDLFDELGKEVVLAKGTLLTSELIVGQRYADLTSIRVAGSNSGLQSDLRSLEERTERQVEVTKQLFEQKKEKLLRGDELPPGVIKLVKVFVAMKR